MSGPIVRTGTTPEFWRGWDRAFGDKTADSAKSGSKKSAAKASGKKAAVTTKAARKPAKKK